MLRPAHKIPDTPWQNEPLLALARAHQLLHGRPALAQHRLISTALAAHTPTPLRVLNLGGGFGTPYFPGEQPLDLASIAANLATLRGVAAGDLPGARLVVELGRYLVGEAVVYVCGVQDRKASRGQVFLVTDGGLRHHLAVSGKFGQVLRKSYPVVVVNRAASPERETASVVGPLCAPLDLPADCMDLARAELGE